MPKSNFCKDKKKECREEKEQAIKEMIDGKLGALNMSHKDLAKKAGINPSTLYARRRNPEELKVGELWAIIDVLKPEAFYLEKII